MTTERRHIDPSRAEATSDRPSDFEYFHPPSDKYAADSKWYNLSASWTAPDRPMPVGVVDEVPHDSYTPS